MTQMKDKIVIYDQEKGLMSFKLYDNGTIDHAPEFITLPLLRDEKITKISFINKMNGAVILEAIKVLCLSLSFYLLI